MTAGGEAMKISPISSTSLPNAFAVSSGALRVTDPCYDMETWCAGTLENVKNGIWQAQVGYHKDELDAQMVERWLAGEKERIDAFAAKYEKDGLGDWIKHEYERLEEKRKGFEARPGRVAYLHIRHENTQSHFDHEAELDSTWGDSTIDVGVDSGQAGFFDLALFAQMCASEPVKDKFYDEICALTCETDGQWGVHPVGAVSSTGYGDGSYTCLVRRDEELKLIEAVIVYLEEYDEEGEEDA
jgi:hypothetical protein